LKETSRPQGIHRNFKQIQSLEQRLTEEAKRLRAKAKLLPPGAAREALIRKAQQAETGSHISEWLASPGLQSPRSWAMHDMAASALRAGT
jgi:hypothetical protein